MQRKVLPTDPLMIVFIEGDAATVMAAIPAAESTRPNAIPAANAPNRAPINYTKKPCPLLNCLMYKKRMHFGKASL